MSRHVAVGVFRFLMGVALAGVFCGCTSTMPQTSNEPALAASRFYGRLREYQVNGLPEGKASKALEPLMTPELAADFRAAKAEQAAFMKKNPDEKPPWIEGDLFSSLFEGFQWFTAGKARVKGDRAEVPMQLRYSGSGDTVRWTDTLVLRRGEKGWLVDDVKYGGNWPFASHGTLKQALRVKED